jgi:hypothetical protein
MIGTMKMAYKKGGKIKELRDQSTENRGQERSQGTGHGKKGERKRAKRQGTKKSGHNSSVVDLIFFPSWIRSRIRSRIRL